MNRNAYVIEVINGMAGAKSELVVDLDDHDGQTYQAYEVRYIDGKEIRRIPCRVRGPIYVRKSRAD